MVPRAVLGEESRGDVRILRNGYFTKVSKSGQVVLVGKKPESIRTTNGGLLGALAPQQALSHICAYFFKMRPIILILEGSY